MVAVLVVAVLLVVLQRPTNSESFLHWWRLNDAYKRGPKERLRGKASIGRETRCQGSVFADTQKEHCLRHWTLQGAESTSAVNHNSRNHNRPYVVTNSPISTTAPKDLLTQLVDAGKLQDPYFEDNFLTQRHVWAGALADNESSVSPSLVWIYTSTTPRPSSLHSSSPLSSSSASDFFSLRNGAATTLTHRQRTLREVESTARPLPSSNASGDPSSQTIPAYEYLIVEGIKMGASIYYQKEGSSSWIWLMNVTNQFRRYWQPLPKLPSPSSASITLRVVLDPTSIDTQGRYMACSGGWDWAPYTQVHDASQQRRPIFSMGILKPITILSIQSAAILHVVPKISYQGNHLRNAMDQEQDRENDHFRVQVDVHLLRPRGDQCDIGGIVQFRADFIPPANQRVQACSAAGKNTTVVTVTSIVRKVLRRDVQLWWPATMNRKRSHLYTIHVRYFNQHTGAATAWVSRRVGFRFVSLVTANEFGDTPPMSSEGSGSHGMYLRVNGVLVWSRGANVVPMDQLDGRVDQHAYRQLVTSAAMAGMTMLRVWGGGLAVLPSSFYDACDELGILLYHDLPFVAEQHHEPQKTEDVEDEVRHTIRQLASHPSIVLWSGCNECQVDMNGPTEIYASFVMRLVAEEDPTRIIWPSCPSKRGWETGVTTATGLPNGRPLQTPPSSDNANRDLEIHGPYNHGSSETHPTVDGHPDDIPYDTKIPVELRDDKVGPQYPNQFVSEFGASVFSSFPSMSASLEERHWSLHGGSPPDNCTQDFLFRNTCHGSNVLAQRNYACDSHVKAYFGSDVDLDSVGEGPFRRQLYMCMMAQTLWMKSQIEFFRSTNSFGMLIWQLNEIWPTGGWGLLEYGSSAQQKGQVLGGRWKPLMHLVRRNLFRDVFVACGKGGKCFCRNDGAFFFAGVVTLERWDLVDGSATLLLRRNVTLEGGRGATDRFEMDASWDGQSGVVLARVESHDGRIVNEGHAILKVEPRNLKGLERHVDVHVGTKLLSERDFLLTIQTNTTALYIVLTTSFPGQFSDNAFHLRPGETKFMTFHLVEPTVVEVQSFQDDLTVEHLGMHLG